MVPIPAVPVLVASFLSLLAVVPRPAHAALRGGPSPLETARPSRDGAYLRQVIARGARIHGTNGIVFGPDGRLYVASDLSRSIAVVDPRSGRIEDRIGPERGVESPDDLAFGPDGSLYWTAFFTGEVGRLLPSGEHRVVARVGPGVNAIAFSDSGRLFVTRVFLGDALYEIDPEGLAPPRTVAAGLGGLNAMQFGPDGRLYGPLWFKGAVARVDVDAGAVEVVATGFATPASVKLDSRGRVLVVDQARAEIVRLDLASGERVVLARLEEPGLDDLAIDPEDRLFVTSAHDGFVRELLPSGEARTLIAGGLVAPAGIAVLPGAGGEQLAVADALSLKRVDALRGELIATAHSVLGVSPLATPLTAHADAHALVTASWFANVVQVLDPDTLAVTAVHRDFAVPIDALRYGGDLVVSELGAGDVVRKRASGERVVLASGLAVPAGLALRGRDVFVAEWATGRVLRLDVDGGAPPVAVAQGLSRPEGLAVDLDGTLLAVESGAGRLVRIDPQSGSISVVDDGLPLGLRSPPGLPPTYLLGGVAVGACGDVYVSVDAESAVARYVPRGAGTPACVR